jgi:hypothetical protein
MGEFLDQVQRCLEQLDFMNSRNVGPSGTMLARGRTQDTCFEQQRALSYVPKVSSFFMAFIFDHDFWTSFANMRKTGKELEAPRLPLPQRLPKMQAWPASLQTTP